MSKQSSRGPKWDALRERVLDRDGAICAYCGLHATTADHVVPKDAGGKDEMDNLVACCITCNGRKSNHLLQRVSGANPKWLTL